MVDVEDGQLVNGTVVKIDNDEVLLDIGYKSEGVIPSRELSIRNDVDPHEVVSLGERVEALVLNKEDKEGRLVLSKKRAQYERAWGDDREDQGSRRRRRPARSSRSSRAASSSTSACVASCPPRSSSCAGSATSQPYVGETLEAKIIELDKNRNNVVLSRRAYLEETQKEQRDEFLANLKPGEVREGVVSVGRQLRCVRRPRRHGRPRPRLRAVVEARRPPGLGRRRRRRGQGAGARRRPRPRAHQPVAEGHPAGSVAGVRRQPPGRRAGLRPGHQARAVRCVRPGRRRHRGPRAHLGDVGAPRRLARAGRHARRGAVGQDHRPRPRSVAASACRSSRPPRVASSPPSTASTSRSTPPATGSRARRRPRPKPRGPSTTARAAKAQRHRTGRRARRVEADESAVEEVAVEDVVVEDVVPEEAPAE